MTERCRKNQVMIRGGCYKDDKKKYGIIMATPVVEREGHVPERIVLRRIVKGGDEEFVTHHQGWMTEKGKVHEPHFFWGHYFIHKIDAVKDFNDRARDY